jgi:hypothetical protein
MPLLKCREIPSPNQMGGVGVALDVVLLGRGLITLAYISFVCGQDIAPTM